MEQGSLRCDVNVSLTPRRQPGARHPHRDQERQLAALGRAGGPVRDRPAGRACSTPAAGSSRRPGTSTRTPAPPRPGRSQGDGRGLPLLPRARPGADRARPRSGSRSCARRCRSCRRRAARRLQAEWGSDRPGDARPGQRRRARPGRATPSPPARRPPRPASGGWAYLAQQANDPRRRAGRAADHPGAGGRVIALVGAGELTTSWPARSSTACWPARATRTRSSRRRGLAVVSRRRRAGRGGRRGDRRQPGRRRQDPRRQGGGGGALVGAVMKATRGQADAEPGPRAGARARRRLSGPSARGRRM